MVWFVGWLLVLIKEMLQKQLMFAIEYIFITIELIDGLWHSKRKRETQGEIVEKDLLFPGLSFLT